MSLQTFLTRTCLVERLVAGSDATGAETSSWTARLTGIPCSIYPSGGGSTANNFARDDLVSNFTLITATDIQATSADRVTIDGLTYGVVGGAPYVESAISPGAVYTTSLFRRN
jgi:hypothetical protein